MSAAEEAQPGEPVDVTADAKGRVRLVAAGIVPGRRYRVELLGDGSERLVLTPLPGGRHLGAVER